MIKDTMALQLEYRELSLLRKILIEKRNDIWQEKYAKSFKKKFSLGQVKVVKDNFDNQRNPHSDVGLIGRLLDKIEKIEDEIRDIIDGVKK